MESLGGPSPPQIFFPRTAPADPPPIHHYVRSDHRPSPPPLPSPALGSAWTRVYKLWSTAARGVVVSWRRRSQTFVSYQLVRPISQSDGAREIERLYSSTLYILVFGRRSSSARLCLLIGQIKMLACLLVFGLPFVFSPPFIVIRLPFVVRQPHIVYTRRLLPVTRPFVFTVRLRHRQLRFARRP